MHFHYPHHLLHQGLAGVPHTMLPADASPAQRVSVPIFGEG